MSAGACRRPPSWFPVIALSLLIVSAAPRISAADGLNEIHKIYLGDFGAGEGADLVREKLRLRLVETGRFSVVESVDAAEAVLTGAAGVSRGYHSNVNSSGGSGTTTYQGYGVLRLILLRTQEPVWFFEYKRGFGFGSRSTRVANQIADKLLKDAEAEARLSTESKPGNSEAEMEKQ